MPDKIGTDVPPPYRAVLTCGYDRAVAGVRARNRRPAAQKECRPIETYSPVEMSRGSRRNIHAGGARGTDVPPPSRRGVAERALARPPPHRDAGGTAYSKTRGFK